MAKLVNVNVSSQFRAYSTERVEVVRTHGLGGHPSQLH